jgi:circadian clock protein KaiC
VTESARQSQRQRVATGVPGLDEVLCGGLPANRLYLLQGDPGVGKTTASLQFLREGVRRGEVTLYVTLSETRDEIAGVMESHGWDVAPLNVYELNIAASLGDPHGEENTLFIPAEVEFGERLEAMLAEVDRVKPQRLVIDSCSELRLLAQTPLRFRRHVLALKENLARRRCTVLMLENPIKGGDVLLQSLVHGVIEMQQLAPMYGAEKRRLRILKMREVRFRGGYHDLTMRHGGIVVYPRLVAAEHERGFRPGALSSGLPALDSLLGGGLDRGTSTLLLGPPGCGKSAVAMVFAHAAADRGERVAIFAFEEGMQTLRARSAALGMPLEAHEAAGRMTLRSIDPAELAPGEFAHAVRQTVEEAGTRIVIIDSLNGYLHAMPDEQYITLQLHELLSYLRHHGVVTLLIAAQHGLMGSGMTSPVDVSYLADGLMLFRFFESAGRVRRALSVVKKRSGAHEDTIRELVFGDGTIDVGEPLHAFHGVLTGVPTYLGDPEPTAADTPVGLTMNGASRDP